jgi:ABC-type lipoprotein release transport system permease subunit
MIDSVTSLYTGHIQIHAKGFQKRMKLEKVVANPAAAEKIVQASPHFKSLSEKVKAEALIGTSEQSSGIILLGIDPAAESKVTRLKNFISKGSFLNPGDETSVVIGQKLAEKLEVSVGDKVVVLVQERRGGMGGMSYHVKGIYKTGAEFLDEATAFVTLQSAQNIFALDKDISEITVRLDGIQSLDAETARIRTLLTAQNPDYEVLPWKEVVPEVDGWIRWDNALIGIILAVVAIVIGIGVMNTVLMSIIERTKEFGILKAVGITPRQLIKLVLLETFFLDLIGILAGTALGLWLVSFFSVNGVPMGAFLESMQSVYMPASIKTAIAADHLFTSIGIMLVLPVVISIYPALRAANLEPVKAIYHS